MEDLKRDPLVKLSTVQRKNKKQYNALINNTILDRRALDSNKYEVKT